MNRSEKAVELKHNGYNCAQAVLASYADILPIDAESLKKLGAAFGVGMGTRDTVCGALAAAQMILGLVKYEGKPILSQAKELYIEFKNICGSTHCGELKGVNKGKVLCSCDDCVRNAVAGLEKFI